MLQQSKQDESTLTEPKTLLHLFCIRFLIKTQQNITLQKLFVVVVVVVCIACTELYVRLLYNFFLKIKF